MPRKKKYPIFISHSWDYSTDYRRLEKMLKGAKYSDFPNYSIPKERKLDTKTDHELEAALRRQISPTHTVLIIAGMYVNHRQWIQKEIDIAESMQKNIVIVKPRGAEKMPNELQKYPQQVGWNTNHIVWAIRNPGKTTSSNQQANESMESEGQSAWQEQITDSPDYKALQEWLNDPDAYISNRPVIRKNPERRKGTSG